MYENLCDRGSIYDRVTMGNPHLFAMPVVIDGKFQEIIFHV